MIEVIGWIANIIAIIAWCINIKYRKIAMFIFTFATLLSIIYFSFNFQLSFLLRMIFYLIIDGVTIWHILVKEKKQ